MPTLIDLTFEDAFVRAMPGDSDRRNVSRQTPGVSYSPVDPTPVAAPSLLAWSDAAGDLLGVTRPALGPGPVADVLAGNRLLPGMRPYAARYGGHQFGHWADQLGDGRAITLGEVRGASGQVLELQLKGAGPTPYSRRADGRAVLRSSVREFLCSEAMHALGVPTTRALSLVATGDTVVRDMFYDGRAAPEPGAIALPGFVRQRRRPVSRILRRRLPPDGGAGGALDAAGATASAISRTSRCGTWRDSARRWACCSTRPLRCSRG